VNNFRLGAWCGSEGGAFPGGQTRASAAVRGDCPTKTLGWLLVEIPVPGVTFQDGQDVGREWAGVRNPATAFDGFDAPHAGDDGADGRMREAETQGDFGQRAGDAG
jgi:hypothetical protein